MELILAPPYPPRFHGILELLEVHVFAAMVVYLKSAWLRSLGHNGPNLLSPSCGADDVSECAD